MKMRKQMSRFIIAFTLLFVAIELSTEASTVYNVQKGDTLWDIAQTYDVSIDHLMEWNALHSSLIYPEQQLTIDELRDEYVVKKGDTLSEIAETHDVSLSTLMSINQITSHLIYPGDRLYLTAEKQQAAAQSNKKVVERPTKEVSHMKKPTASTAKRQKTTTNDAQVKKKEEQQVAHHQQAEQTKKDTPSAAPTAKGKEMMVTATAYTAYCEGCSGTTYTGINLRANPNQKVIAVDPNVIPLGSKVWVEGYGEAIAGDIGGAIKGNKIDVFLEHKSDAYQWGRKQVKIKVLE